MVDSHVFLPCLLSFVFKNRGKSATDRTQEERLKVLLVEAGYTLMRELEKMYRRPGLLKFECAEEFLRERVKTQIPRPPVLRF